MSFKSEAAKVRGNIASGEYKQKRDYFGGFVEQVAYGIRKRDEERAEEEKEKRRQARAAAASVAAEQKKEDAKLKRQEKLVNGYLTINGWDATEANKSAVRSVIMDLDIDNFGDLDAVMSKTSTYVAGTPQAEIDQQMSDLGQLRQGDGPFEAEKDRVSKLSAEGRIEFGKPRGKDPLQMTLDEVRYELSNPSITADRRADLERREASLKGPTEFVGVPMYHADGRVAEPPRTETEEQELIDQGFKTIKPAAPEDFEPRTLYRNGAKLPVYSRDDLEIAIADGWSETEPAKPEEFKPFTMYAEDGRKIEIRNQEMLKEFSKQGSEFGLVQPAPDKSYPRTLYDKTTGAQVEVFTESEMNVFKEKGFDVVKPATEQPFTPRTMYKGNQEVRVVNKEEYVNYLKLGFGDIKTNPEDYTQRTYYKDGKEVRVLNSDQQVQLEQDGWGPVKLDDIAQIMADLNVDRKTAAQIQNGTLKLTTDFGGNPIIVDIATTTSKQITPEGADGDQPNISADLNATLSRFDPNWKENGLTMVVDGKQMTFTPEQIQQNEAFKINTNSLEGLDGAFGLSGVFNKLVGKAGDIVGAELSASQNQAIAFMENLRLNTLVNLAAAQAGGLRDSVWNKQQIIKTLPEPAKLFEGPFEARNKTKETLRSIKTSLQLIKKAKESGTINKAALSQSTITEASLRELEATYEAVIKAFDAALGEAPKAQPSYIKKKDS